jgi:hypothetical protein
MMQLEKWKKGGGKAKKKFPLSHPSLRELTENAIGNERPELLSRCGRW